jgi:PhnB protein
MIAMDIVPNLHFNGDCEKAIELYEAAFGARRLGLLRHEDANPLDIDGQSTTMNPGSIYHAEIMIGDQRIILNDNDEELPSGLNVSLLVSMDTMEDVKTAYETLKEGATIRVPLRVTTYSRCFVSLIDRYGVRWELIKENA